MATNRQRLTQGRRAVKALERDLAAFNRRFHDLSADQVRHLAEAGITTLAGLFRTFEAQAPVFDNCFECRLIWRALGLID